VGNKRMLMMSFTLVMTPKRRRVGQNKKNPRKRLLVQSLMKTILINKCSLERNPITMIITKMAHLSLSHRQN